MRRAKIARVVTMAALATAGLLAAAGTATAGVSSSAPYHDPNVKGYLGLCDRAGRQITQGSISTKPFAWRVVSSQPAQAPYNQAGRTATLYAYQPRKGIPAGEWSGDSLTASARYSNPSHPMTAATTRDDSLKNFIAEFRPVWNGFLQIRMYLGAPDQPAYSLTYPALDVQVTGNSWHAVGGGPVSCTGGTSESIETILLPKADFTKHRHSTHGSATPHSNAAPGNESGSSSTGTGLTAPTNPVVNTASTSGGSRGTGLLVALLAIAVVLFGALGYIFLRTRSPSPHPRTLVRRNSEKGR
ncbi:MAG TPA: hypothetical protein VME70_12660 [Mycobacteriales bacterium]|nr:hypothetical protein [Mycobacteriales bacterium]